MRVEVKELTCSQDCAMEGPYLWNTHWGHVSPVQLDCGQPALNLSGSHCSLFW